MSGPSVVARSTQTRVLHLPGGERVVLRAIRPSDADRLQAYIRGLSAEARHNRFLGAVGELSPRQLDRVTHMDRLGELALIALAGDGDEGTIVGEAMHVMAPEGHRCEIALSVADPWQGRGLGTLLLRDIECRARLIGARHLVGDVLRTNAAMKGLARKAGFAINGPCREARLIEIAKDLSAPPIGLPCEDAFAAPIAA
jgi:GNAT superfamily N-acetyltransferase